MCVECILTLLQYNIYTLVTGIGYYLCDFLLHKPISGAPEVCSSFDRIINVASVSTVVCFCNNMHHVHYCVSLSSSSSQDCCILCSSSRESGSDAVWALNTGSSIHAWYLAYNNNKRPRRRSNKSCQIPYLST